MFFPQYWGGSVDADRFSVHPLDMPRWSYIAVGLVGMALVAAGQAPADKCRVEGTVLNAVTGPLFAKFTLPLRRARAETPCWAPLTLKSR
jgi:hypothetical protein